MFLLGRLSRPYNLKTPLTIGQIHKCYSSTSNLILIEDETSREITTRFRPVEVGCAREVMLVKKKYVLVENKFPKVMQRSGKINRVIENFKESARIVNVHVPDTNFNLYAKRVATYADQMLKAELIDVLNTIAKIDKETHSEIGESIDHVINVISSVLVTKAGKNVNEILSYLDIWCAVPFTRRTRFVDLACHALEESIHLLTPEQTIQSLLYFGWGSISPYRMQSFEYKLIDIMDRISLNELAIATLGFNGSNYEIKTMELLPKMYDRLLEENLLNIKKKLLVPLLKILGNSYPLENRTQIMALQEKLIEVAEDTSFNIETCASIAKFTTATRICNENLIQAVAQRFRANIHEARIKDFVQIAFAFAMFDFTGENGIEKTLSREILRELRRPERDNEITECPLDFMTCLLYLAEKGFNCPHLVLRALSQTSNIQIENGSHQISDEALLLAPSAEESIKQLRKEDFNDQIVNDFIDLIEGGDLPEIRLAYHMLSEPNYKEVLRKFSFLKQTPYRNIETLFEALALEGDIATLKMTYSSLTIRKKFEINYDYYNSYAKACSVAGLACEWCDEWSSKIDTFDTLQKQQSFGRLFPIIGFWHLLENNPDAIENCEALASKYAARQISKPMDAMWCYYIIHGNQEAAANVWRKYIVNRKDNDIYFDPIIQKANRENNDNFLKEIIESQQTWSTEEEMIQTNRKLHGLYSIMLEILARRSEFDQALATVKLMKKRMMDPSVRFNRIALLQIKNVFKVEAKPFPYTLKTHGPEQRIK